MAIKIKTYYAGTVGPKLKIYQAYKNGVFLVESGNKEKLLKHLKRVGEL